MLPKNQEWYSWENLISGGTFATPTELDHDYELMKPVFFLVETKRLKENLINSVVYCKTALPPFTFFVGVCYIIGVS